MGKFINCAAAVKEMLLSSRHVDVEESVREAASVLEQPSTVTIETYSTDYPPDGNDQPPDSAVASPHAAQFGIEEEDDKAPHV